MTKEYPRLTVENIRYWYWECFPHWSQRDIAKEIGCSPSLVSYYMRKKRIPTRNYSEAQINRWNCPHKLKEFKRKMNLDEVKEAISDALQNAWKEPRKRKSLVRANQKRVEDIIGYTQFLLLKTLSDHPNRYLTLRNLSELEHLRSFTKKQLDLALGRLCRRGFVKRKKHFRDYKSKVRVYYYNITKQGERIYKLNKDQETIEEIKKWHRINKNITQNQVGPRMGKLQKKIIFLIKEKGPLFFSEINCELEQHRSSAVQHSLKLMIEKKKLFRRKKLNWESLSNDILEFKYYLKEPEKDIEDSYVGLGLIQANILILLSDIEKLTYKDFTQSEPLRDFSSGAIENALTSLYNCFLIRRTEKGLDDAGRGFFYSISEKGKILINQVK